MIRGSDRHRIGQARLLRRQGKTYAEIEAVVGCVGESTLKQWLRGIPRPRETYRSRGLPELAKECRRLRSEGLTQGEIRAKTGATVGSLSGWLRDVKVPASAEARRQAHLHELRSRGSKALHDAAVARQQARVAVARSSIQPLSDRELLLIGVALYWAEGSKDKPWRPEQWWTTELGLRENSFDRATVKRHNPKPTRHNRNDTYHGCVVVSIARSIALYDSIDGWWQAISDAVVL